MKNATTVTLKNRRVRVSPNGLFDFLKPTTTVYRKKSKRGHSRGGSGPETRYKGIRITTLFGGEYTTSIDPDSRFDSMRDAKRFIDYWKRKNPAKFDRCVKKVKASLKKSKRSGSAYAICKAGTRNASRVTDLVPGSDMIVDTLARTGSAWAGVAKRVGKGVKGAVKGAARKIRGNPNGIEKARQVAEEFHGLKNNKIVVVESREHVHDVVAGLAKLVCLNVVGTNGRELPPLIAPGFKYSGKMSELWLRFKGRATGAWEYQHSTDAVRLTVTKDRTQLLFTGGDQSINTEALGFGNRDERDNMLIGTIHRIWYRTKKNFEQDGKEHVDFFHDFGSEGSKGELPVLIYHPRNPSIEMAGGRYYIAPLDKSIGASPGIVG